MIPSKVHQRSKILYERVFGWRVKQRLGTTSMDVLPRFRKGSSAELNSDVEIIIPSILASDIDAKLKLIEKFGGKKLTARPLSARAGNRDTMRFLRILKETRCAFTSGNESSLVVSSQERHVSDHLQ
jgi:predicted enzyme related to lactoylglutathione lyase